MFKVKKNETINSQLTLNGLEENKDLKKDISDYKQKIGKLEKKVILKNVSKWEGRVVGGDFEKI